MPFILLFFLITVLFGLVALSFKALGWGGVLRAAWIESSDDPFFL